MSEGWVKFFKFKFFGERYESKDNKNPGLDLRDLEELINVRDALFDLAEHRWRSENRRQPLPAGFRENLEVRIFEFEPGSCQSPFAHRAETLPPVVPVAEARDTTARQREAGKPMEYYVRGAAMDLISTWKSAQTDSWRAQTDLPAPLEAKIAKIGSTRSKSESFGMEFVPLNVPGLPKGQMDLFTEAPIKLVITAEERTAVAGRLVTPKTIVQVVEKSGIAIEGDVTEANRLAKSAYVRIGGPLSGEKPIAVKLSNEGQAETAIAAFAKDSHLWVHMVGTAEMDEITGKILRLKRTDTVSPIPAKLPYSQSLLAWPDYTEGKTEGEKLLASDIELLRGDSSGVIDEDESDIAPQGNDVATAVQNMLPDIVNFVGIQLGHDPWVSIARALVDDTVSKGAEEITLPHMAALAKANGYRLEDVHLVVEKLAGAAGRFLERAFLLRDAEGSLREVHSDEVASRLRGVDSGDEGAAARWREWSSTVKVVWRWYAEERVTS